MTTYKCFYCAKCYANGELVVTTDGTLECSELDLNLVRVEFLVAIQKRFPDVDSCVFITFNVLDKIQTSD